VTVDGRRARKGDSVREGQTVVAVLHEEQDHVPAPADLEPLVVTKEAVIVDKPAGMPSAKVPNSAKPDAASALALRFPEMRGVGYDPREPGLVHRLDTFTSGLLLAARSASAFERLRQALRDGRLLKRYLAIVEAKGLPAEGTVDGALASHPKNKKKVVVDRGGRPSSTSYHILERHGVLALLGVSAGPAYRHQIRVHLASIGHPLLGDELYGGPPTPLLGPGRHALHASYLSCSEPDLETFEVRAVLPDDMRRLLVAAD
jgi:23S rRNA pseudouridine1911/1915/1917 synthase